MSPPMQSYSRNRKFGNIVYLFYAYTFLKEFCSDFLFLQFCNYIWISSNILQQWGHYYFKSHYAIKKTKYKANLSSATK